MSSENKIKIPLKKTFIQKILSVFPLALLLWIMYNIITTVNQENRVLYIYFSTIAFLCILLEIYNLFAPNKIILYNDRMLIYNAHIIFRKYSIKKIKSIEIIDIENITLSNLLKNQYNLTDEICLIKTNKKDYYFNFKRKYDVERFSDWLKNSGNTENKNI